VKKKINPKVSICDNLTIYNPCSVQSRRLPKILHKTNHKKP
jgi:hypothetical protein